MPFESLGLRAELHRAVSEKGYSAPTPIQQQAIPLILEGRDLMGGAQTGTGKTAGFTLPILQRIISTDKTEKTHRAIRALVLTPTRELAAQVSESVITYGKYLPLRSAVIHGGVSYRPQIQKLRKGIDILVATPGRLLDHVGQNTVDLSKVDILVLDEADRMLDMGFIHDIRKIIAQLPKHKQTLLFSATFSNEIKKLSKDLLKSPALIEVAQRNTTAERVTQIIHPVDRNRKRELLSYLVGTNNWQQVLVFARTKHGADRLSKQLIQDGITAAAIHGDKSQGARTKALANFKANNVRVLVATDIAARGLDINQLPHVINFDLPNVAEDYVHRIGRTGRAGNEGEAMSLVCLDELKQLSDIERLIRREIPRVVINGFELDPSIKAPVEKKASKNKNNNKGRGKKRIQRNKNGKSARNTTANKNSTGKKNPRKKLASPQKRKHSPFSGRNKSQGKAGSRSRNN